MNRLCECGCNQEVDNPNSRFKRWHRKKGMTSPRKGAILSKETKDKISLSITGKKRLDMVGKKPWNLGLIHTVDTRIKMSANHVGMTDQKHNEQSRLLMSKSHIGKKLSDDHKRKLRESMILYVKKINKTDFSPNIGKHEIEFISELQKHTSFPIIRTYQIDGFFIDGYIKEINVAIELDESAHDNISMINRHIYRENYLHKKYNFLFFRVKENEWLKNKDSIVHLFESFIDIRTK